jgi:sulfate/thiosulfate transport system permease protein
MSDKFKGKNRILPFFGLSLGYTTFFLSLVVLLPLSGLFLKAFNLSSDEFLRIVMNERVVASYKLSITTAFIAALFNVVFGVILCWVIVRYDFFGKKFLDAFIDFPFALPTSIAGIALTTLYSSEGWIGKALGYVGIKVAFTPLGIIVALVFVGLPFVVRTVEPVLKDFDKEIEEAAQNLGATNFQIFYKVMLPVLFPAILTGFAMAFARGLGEYGSVVFIAGNIPGVSEIVPLLINIQLEQYDYEGAAAIATVMLLLSFSLLLLINMMQKWYNKSEK